MFRMLINLTLNHLSHMFSAVIGDARQENLVSEGIENLVINC